VLATQRLSSLPSVHCQLLPLRHLPAAHSTAASLAVPHSLRSTTAASAPTHPPNEAVSSLIKATHRRRTARRRVVYSTTTAAAAGSALCGGRCDSLALTHAARGARGCGWLLLRRSDCVCGVLLWGQREAGAAWGGGATGSSRCRCELPSPFLRCAWYAVKTASQAQGRVYPPPPPWPAAAANTGAMGVPKGRTSSTSTPPSPEGRARPAGSARRPRPQHRHGRAAARQSSRYILLLYILYGFINRNVSTKIF
jgi:hypothetical protein